jgi:hypothetical protein
MTPGVTVPVADLTAPDDLTRPDGEPRVLNRPEGARRMQPVLHAPIGGGYSVKVFSPRHLSGPEYCAVLRWYHAIVTGFASRPAPDDAEMGV